MPTKVDVPPGPRARAVNMRSCRVRTTDTGKARLDPGSSHVHQSSFAPSSCPQRLGQAPHRRPEAPAPPACRPRSEYRPVRDFPALGFCQPRMLRDGFRTGKPRQPAPKSPALAGTQLRSGSTRNPTTFDRLQDEICTSRPLPQSACADRAGTKALRDHG